MTVILKINPKKIDIERLKIAAKCIKQGGIVVFPTETVYGIGANVFDKNAAQQLFKIKKRPADNPLIVHIAKFSQLKHLVSYVPKKAKILMKKFWPGPLTLVLPKKRKVPNIVTAGLDTVAVRMPSHPVAKTLIELSESPIAAPSANISGTPSCASGKHTKDDFFGKVDIIIDSGKTNIGLESTIVKIGKKSYLLRPGKITLEELRKLIPNIEIHTKSKRPLAPGMKYRHYAPKAKLILLEKDKWDKKIPTNTILITTRKIRGPRVIYFKNKTHLAKNLFYTFRELDRIGVKRIIVEGVNESDIGLAIMNRLRKASSKIL